MNMLNNNRIETLLKIAGIFLSNEGIYRKNEKLFDSIERSDDCDLDDLHNCYLARKYEIENSININPYVKRAVLNNLEEEYSVLLNNAYNRRNILNFLKMANKVCEILEKK